MKLFTLALLLEAAVTLDAKPLELPFGLTSELVKRPNHHGLEPVERVCAGIIGGTLTATLCAQGVSGAIDRMANNCKGKVGYQCIQDWVAYVGFNFLEYAGAAYGIAYAFGFVHGTGVARRAHDVALTGRDVSNVSPTSHSQGFGGFARVLTPLNHTLPRLPAAQVDKNLTFPFTFEKDGWTSTYFPAGFEVDPRLLFYHALPGANDTHVPASVGERFTDPEKLGLVRKSVAESEPHQCTGGYTNSDFYMQMEPNRGIYLESVSVCGHPDRKGDAKFRDDVHHIYTSIPDYAVHQQKLVVEAEVHNKFNSYTFSNVRLVGELASFSNCFEGQHLDAFCDK